MSRSGAITVQSAVAAPTTGSPTTTTTAFTDLAEMSITLTTKGGPVLLEFLGAFTHTFATGRIDVQFQVDSAQSAGVQSVTDPVVGNLFQVMTMHRYTAAQVGAAGSHTFKVQWATTTATATASGTARVFRATELPA